jgi:hypothetical protein
MEEHSDIACVPVLAQFIDVTGVEGRRPSNNSVNLMEKMTKKE